MLVSFIRFLAIWKVLKFWLKKIVKSDWIKRLLCDFTRFFSFLNLSFNGGSMNILILQHFKNFIDLIVDSCALYLIHNTYIHFPYIFQAWATNNSQKSNTKKLAASIIPRITLENYFRISPLLIWLCLTGNYIIRYIIYMYLYNNEDGFCKI